jgi:hypothetical protein
VLAPRVIQIARSIARHLPRYEVARLDDAEASLARGEGIPITPDSMRALADDVKRCFPQRLAAELPSFRT